MILISGKNLKSGYSVSRVLSLFAQRTVIHLRRRLRAACCNPPGRTPENAALYPLRDKNSSLFGFASSGACRAAHVTASAVRSYRTVSPLPFNKSKGGLFSVALSLRLPLPDVIRRPVFVKPGLSSLAGFPHLRARPSEYPLFSRHPIAFA